MYGYPNYVIWGKIIFIGHNYHELVNQYSCINHYLQLIQLIYVSYIKHFFRDSWIKKKKFL